MENLKKTINKSQTRNLILSSIVWATVIIACGYSMDGSNKEIMYILISGFFIEFFRITSSNKSLKKDLKKEEV